MSLNYRLFKLVNYYLDVKMRMLNIMFCFAVNCKIVANLLTWLHTRNVLITKEYRVFLIVAIGAQCF